MPQVVVRSARLEKDKRLFAPAMHCQPTRSEWSEFDRIIAGVNAFAYAGRSRGGIVIIRLREGVNWQDNCKFAGRSMTNLDLPQAILQGVMAQRPADKTRSGI